jgi:hypothetical protein
MIASHEVGVPEWLSGMTRNHVGFARAGSNPAAHVLFLLKLLSMTLARDFTPFFLKKKNSFLPSLVPFLCNILEDMGFTTFFFFFFFFLILLPSLVSFQCHILSDMGFQ